MLTNVPPDPNKLKLHHGDLSDSTNLVYIIAQVQPTEVYNLGAQSHVKVSFGLAEYTTNRQAVPARRDPDMRIREGHALRAAWPGLRDAPVVLTICYLGGLPRGAQHARVQRHPLQPHKPASEHGTFMTCKISRAAADIHKQNQLSLGRKPENFVLATGEMYPVREYVEKAFKHLGYDIK